MILQKYYHKFKRVLNSAFGKTVIHFIHIGKTGGSAVKYALKPYYNNRKFTFVPHSHSFRFADAPAGEKVIFFLRDPLSRFVSGFYSRQRQGQPRLYSPWTPQEKTAFEQFDTANQLAEALGSNDKARRDQAATAMNSISHVRSHYWEWFSDREYFLSRADDVFFIGFQESLNDDFEILKRKLGLPDSVSLPKDEVVSHRNPQNIDKKISDLGIDNLKQWYSQDYQFIQFCKEFIKEHHLNKP